MSNSFTRPTSVMSLLAEKMQCEMSLIESCSSRPINISSSKKHSSISSSAPTYRHSIPGTCINCPNHPCNNSYEDDEYQLSNEFDLGSPQFPSKRLCHSSTNECITRPIPIKLGNKCQFRHIPETSGGSDYGNVHDGILCYKSILAAPKNPPNLNVRPIKSPHYKKSAFTPTGSLISPQTSSDYSISPDIESPVHRPVSTTSSGFHDCSQQSLLIDPNYSPDSNQRSNCATIVNTRPPECHTSIFPRCHSQPCDEPISRNAGNQPVFIGPESICTDNSTCTNHIFKLHTQLKRRYTSPRRTRTISHSDHTTGAMFDSPTKCHCNKMVPNSAGISPSASTSLFAAPKRDSYFFGGGRSYFISLPRIASSPPPPSIQGDPQNNNQTHRQRIGSNSSSHSTSTTTDANTPTVILNVSVQQRHISDSTNNSRDNIEDVEMSEMLNDKRSSMSFHQIRDEIDYTPEKNPLPPNSELSCNVPEVIGSCSCASPSSCSVSAHSDLTTKSYSVNSDDTSHGTHASRGMDSGSSRSEFRDPDDPPEIGFCFSQLNDHQDDIAYNKNSSFQALDLDQIELD